MTLLQMNMNLYMQRMKKSDLSATAQELAGGNIEISDEQMQRMMAMYRHDEDSNVAMNDTLESVVCRVLGRN